MEVLFDIADALEVDPADLITASVFPDQILLSWHLQEIHKAFHLWARSPSPTFLE